MSSFIDNFTSTDWLKQMKRADAFPLDKSCIFSSFEDAKKYAKQDANDLDSRKLAMTSYIGQILAIYENDNVSCYIIDENRNLAPIGEGIRYKGELEVGQPTITNISNPNIGDLYKIKLAEDPALSSAYIPQTLSNVYDIFGSYFDGCIRKYKFGNDTDYTDCYVLINDGNYDNGMCKKFVENKIFDMGSKLHICYTDPDAGKLTQTVTISEIRYESNQYVFIVTNSSSGNTILSKFQEGQGNAISIGIESIEFDTSVNDGDYILYNGEYFELFLDDFARKDDVKTNIENNISFGGEKNFDELSNDEALKKEKVIYKINAGDNISSGEIKIYSYKNDSPTDTGTYTISDTSPKYTIQYSAADYSNPSQYPDLVKLINACDKDYTIDYKVPITIGSKIWTGTAVLLGRNGPTLILNNKLAPTVEGEVSTGTTVTITAVYKSIFANNGDYAMWNGTDWSVFSQSIKPIDNLTSTDKNKSLSANQGKVLNDKITKLDNNKANTIDLVSNYTPYPFWKRNKRYKLNQIVCHDDETGARDKIAFYKWTVPSEVPDSELDLTAPPVGDTNNWEPVSIKNAINDSDGNKIIDTYVKKDGNKVLSTNDYTNDAKTTVDGLGYSTPGNIIKYDLTKNAGSKDVHITSSVVNATDYVSAGDVFTDNATIENIFIENTTGDFSSIRATTKGDSEEVKNLQSVLDKKADKSIEIGIKYYNNPNIKITPEIYFTVNSTGETITGLTETGKTQTELVIPYSINNKIITKIGEAAFSNNTNIHIIVLPNTINNISMAVFSGCSNLTSVNIPDTDFIASHLFSGCTSLKYVNIPTSVTGIGSQAFNGCISLRFINIPNSVANMDSSAFTDCIKLATVYCEQGSYADTYFTANYPNINIIYTDINKTELDKKADKADLASVYKVKGSLDPNTNLSPNVRKFSFGSTLKTGDVYNISADITDNSIKGIANSIWYDTTTGGLPECVYTTDESSSNMAYLDFTDKSYNNLIGNCKLVLATTQAAINSITIDIVYGLDSTNNKIAIKQSSELTSGTKYYLYHIERDRVPVKKGDNVVWIDNYGWDKLASDIDLSNYVTKADYASTSKAGIVKVDSTYGTAMTDDNILKLVSASNPEIRNRLDYAHVITPGNLEYAVQSVRPKIATTLPETIDSFDGTNTIYQLGEQSNLNIKLPDNPPNESFIEIDFYSGTTPTVLNITSDAKTSTIDIEPEINTMYSLFFDWGLLYYDTTNSTMIKGWRFNYTEYFNKEA